MKRMIMKKLPFVLVALPIFGIADGVYDEFLRLKQKGEEARVSFCHSMSNGLITPYLIWKGDECGGTFVSTNINGGVSNVEYYVDIIKVSTNIVSTNLSQICQNFFNGEILRYTYAKSQRLSVIEHVLDRKGNFKCYEVYTNEDLACYYSMTNFYGEHGLMLYKDGQLIETGGVPDFSNLRE